MKKLFIILALLFVLISCSQKQEQTSQVQTSTGTSQALQEKQDKKETIFTSFYPLYFLTKGIVGDTFEVVNLVPTGGEPHEYEPTPKQVEDMLKSRFVLMNGLGMEHYEEKLTNLLATNNVSFVHLSEKLKNIIDVDNYEDKDNKENKNNEEKGHDHGSTDPHTWLSPKVMVDLSKLLVSELQIEQTETVKKFMTDIQALDKKFSDTLALCKKKELVTSHEAFAYLARDYGLKQIAITGIEPDMEPSAADIARVIQVVKDEKVKTLFTEPLVSPKFTDTIARETGASTLELHPLETLTPDEEAKGENYITIMEKNLEKIAEGLNCR